MGEGGRSTWITRTPDLISCCSLASALIYLDRSGPSVHTDGCMMAGPAWHKHTCSNSNADSDLCRFAAAGIIFYQFSPDLLNSIS